MKQYASIEDALYDPDSVVKIGMFANSSYPGYVGISFIAHPPDVDPDKYRRYSDCTLDVGTEVNTRDIAIWHFAGSNIWDKLHYRCDQA